MTSIAQKDFSPKTLSLLAKKGVCIVSVMAVPAFEGDKYFSGTAYSLSYNGQSFIRRHSQILTMAVSSWHPSNEGSL